MTLIKLQFQPGINRDKTDYSNEGGWRDCDKIRFRSGFPQKLGGWLKHTPTSFLGTCRQLWNWVTTFGDDFLAVPTNIKTYVEAGGYFYNITPLRTSSPTLSTPNTDNCVATSNTSTTVTINLGTAHGASTGNYVTIAGVTGTVGGIPNSEINANHYITVIDADSFSITVSTAATSTVAAGGGTAITISFEIAPGYALPTGGYGWGAGTWSRDYWGLGTTGTPIALDQTDWWLDNFDNDLIMNIRNGEGYIWERGSTADPSTALATRAIRLITYATNEGYVANDVPIKIGQLLVSQRDKHLIAFGAVPFGSTSASDFDPLLIRWADQDTPGDWTPSETNSAGDLRVSRGSRIVRALPTRQEILFWTDTSLHGLQFQGNTDVFGIQEYSTNLSIISPRAVTSAKDVVYWMGRKVFYVYTGRVETLPCTVTDYIFEDINYSQVNQIVSGTNEQWSEIWWFYPSAASTWNDRYVVYNYLENLWYYGTLSRTAWLDTRVRNNPIGVTSNSTTYTTGYIYTHEYGIEDDTSAMSSYIQSSDFDIGDGDYMMLTNRIIPDLTFDNSTVDEPSVTLQVRPRRFPGESADPDTFDSQSVIQTDIDNYTKQVFVRARARQMAFKLSSTATGVNWRLGTSRLDVRRDGRG